MAKRKPAKRSRIFWRGGSESRSDGSVVHRTRRAYADFRDFADVGGGREPLIPSGSARATEDAVVAEALVTARLAELQRLRRGRAMFGEGKPEATLAAIAERHLILKKESGASTDRWLVVAELHLRRACAFFGASRQLVSIGVADVQQWIAHLERIDSSKGGKLSPGTVRHHINSLSNLYRRAASLSLIPSGVNPVASMMPGEKPAGSRQEARWLEVHEASWLLEVARRTPATPQGCPYLYPLLATFLLTGGRRSEVLGLTVDDVSFDRSTITFRPNEWRRLKTKKSWRTVPLWPQLAEILRPHITPLDRTPREGLLFPAEGRSGAAVMVSNFNKALDTIAKRAGWKAGEVRSRMFRNCYAGARLQTVEGGAPVSPYTVSRELGHGSLSMIEEIYGHLGTVRHRASVVEFRHEQHRAKLEERFGAVVTTLLSPLEGEPNRQYR